MALFRKSAPTSPAPDFTRGAGIAFKSTSFTDVEGKRTIIDNFTLHLTAQSTAILGLNGSGKSTLLKLINGINTPTSGSVTVDGVPVTGNETSVRKRIGLIFSNPLAQLLMPTPAEDIELSLHNTIKDAPTRTQHALQLLRERNIAHLAHSSVYDLSGGEQQLVALTSVLAVEPKILLLDEPTTLLDLKNQLRLYNLLDELPQQLVISTHDLDLAARCKQVMIVHQGKLFARGEAATIIRLYRQWCATGFPAQPHESARNIT